MSQIKDEIEGEAKSILSKFNLKDKLYAITTIALLILLFFRECSHTKSENDLIESVLKYKSEAKYYVGKFGEQIASNDALNISTQKQIKTILATNDTLKSWIKNFKVINSGTIVKENTIIREVKIPFETKIPCDFKPFKVDTMSKYFNFWATLSNSGMTLDSIKIPNEQRIIIGEKKKGLWGLGGTDLKVEVQNSNPNIKISNLQTYQYVPKKKWYDTRAFNIFLGAGAATATYLYFKK